ncbi:hypothetical protein Acy02nite_63910 [Actinoplanes cyaneus]|uniref:Uncharacterized protein n=1 Tax=Actinoplanes cyaneus TaxID=52696 RepID=A0A919M3P6_9ACTN|nr:hypothetical protein Acy02nite_63910 [Actinoplanes cyaneus]
MADPAGTDRGIIRIPAGCRAIVGKLSRKNRTFGDGDRWRLIVRRVCARPTWLLSVYGLGYKFTDPSVAPKDADALS